MVDSPIDKRFKVLEERVAALEALMAKPDSPTTLRVNKTKSPKEFLLHIKPNSVVQATLALGYYHEHELGEGAFIAIDLERMFRSAKEKVPANINDMVNKNIQKGYMMEDKDKKNGKKSWVLTSTGENYVQNKFKEE